MEFGILGSLVVRRDGLEVPVRAAKQRSLLALLLLRRGELVPTETLIDELWGERPPATAAKALQVYVSQLRKLLGEGTIETRPAGYLLRLDPGALDAAQFEDLLERGRSLLAAGQAREAGEALREALGLWRGPPLAEFRYDDFARDEIGRLEGLRLVALEERLEADLALGRHAEAVPELEALVREHPLRETLRELLMLALYRAGRQADALAAYQDARTALVEEQGLDPSESLQRLETAILRHDATLDLPAPIVPVRPSGPSVGRDPSATRAVVRRIVVACGAIAAAAALIGVILLIGRGGPGPAAGSAAHVGANAVLAVDSSTRRVVDAAPLGAAPDSIAYGQGSIWVTLPNQDSVARVDPTTSTVQQTIPVGKGPTGIAAGGGFVWVANTLDGTVTQIDPRTNGGQVVNKIPVGNRPTGVAYGLGGVWVANSIDHTVVRIDPVAGVPGRPMAVDAGADAIAVGAGAVWVTSESTGILSRIDPRGGGSVIPINVGNGPDAVAAGPGAVWVANSGDATVSRVDPATNRVTSLIPVGEGPSGIAIAPSGSSVWVSNKLAGTLSRIDPEVDRVVGTVPLGDLPQGVVASSETPFVAVRDSGRTHRGGTLTLAVPNPAGVYTAGFPKSLDPAGGYTDWELLTLTNDGLVGYGRSGGADSYKIVPDLAVTLPTPGDGGRTYTFQLRPGIHYSTGELVQPQDIRRGIERALLLSGGGIPSSYLGGIVGAAGCVSTPKRCDLSRGIATGPDTVTFHLTAADPDFLFKLALPIADAVPASTPLDARLPLPATGPYEIAEIDAKRPKPAVIHLVRNPHFHLWSAAAQPDGFPDEIVERFGYSAEHAVDAVERGTADLTGDGLDYTWSAPLTARLRTRYSSRLYHAPIPGTTAVWLNTKLPPFDDRRVRQALNYAVDRNHLIELAGGTDIAQVGCQLLPPNTDGYRRYCPYTLHPDAAGTYNGPDLAKARRLVAASGTRGQSVTVWFYDVRIGLLNGAYFVSVLRSLGYDARLEIIPHEGSTWRPDRQAGVGGATEDFPSANGFFSPTFSCRAYDPGRPNENLNVAAFCDRRIDAEMSRARDLQTTDPPAASRLWSEIDRRLTLEALWVVIRTDLAPDFVSRRTGNYTYCYLSDVTGSTGACLDQLWVR